METIIYKGKKRAFIHITNYGDVYLNKGDIITIRKVIDNYYLDVNGKLKNWRVLASTAISYSKYGIIRNDNIIPFIKDMLTGRYKTSLEISLERIKTIANNLPKEDFKLMKWQSNGFYPVYDIKYINGGYLGVNTFNKPKKAIDIAWDIYYNSMNLLPKEYYNAENSLQYKNSIELY